MPKPDVTIPDAEPPADLVIEDVVVGETFDATVQSALDHLPDRFRRVVELVDIDGLTYQEADDVLGVPTGTVMSRLHRARKRLRTRLEQRGYRLGVEA